MGSYAAAFAKSNAKVVAAGDEHSSHSDEELIAALPNTYFKPVQCDEKETPFTGPTTILNEKRVLRRHEQLVRQESDIHSFRGTGQGIPTADPHVSLQNAGVPEAKTTRQLPRTQNYSSNESSTESSCSARTLGARCREAQALSSGSSRGNALVTSVPVDQTYEFPQTELAAMSDKIAWLIQDIEKLDGHRRKMMEELKVLRDITLFYKERHPELHMAGSTARPKKDIDSGSARKHCVP